MASFRRSAQKTIRAHGSSKCPNHCGKQVLYFCENCKELVCADCVIKEHKGHDLNGFDNILPGAKQKLEDFVTTVEHIEIPRIKRKSNEVDKGLSKNKKHFQIQISKVRNQNETIKKKLDKIAASLVKTYHDMEEQSSSDFLIHKAALKSQLTELTARLNEVKTTVESGNDALVYDTSNAIPSAFDDNVLSPTCNTAEFIPGRIDLQELEQLLGEVNIIGKSCTSLSLNPEGQWEVVSDFTPWEGHYVKALRAVTGGQLWLAFSKTHANDLNQLILVNQMGKIQQRLSTDVPVTDFCISPQSGEIWYCYITDGNVRRIDGDKSVRMFRTKDSPLLICVTKDDHVVVGCIHEIVKYTQAGQVVCQIASSHILCSICECPITNNLAVSYDEFSAPDQARVHVFNEDLQLMYNYKGEKNATSKNACFTRAGEVVIIYNRSVVLVSGTGKHLKTLYTHTSSSPRAVCVLNSTIMVSFMDGSVKYLNFVRENGWSFCTIT